MPDIGYTPDNQVSESHVNYIFFWKTPKLFL